MTELLERHWQRLSAFIDGQRALAGEEQLENIDLKRRHTRRVLDNARLITRGVGAAQGLDFQLAETAHLAALYHDTGRFPQLVRYGTFKDRDSDNHGRMGVRALRAEGFLDDLAPGRRKTIMAAVILHNRRSLPPDLPPDIDFCARAVRDADKLDIMHVMIEHLRPDSPLNKTVTLDLVDEPGSYTPLVLEQVLSRAQANYADMRYVEDFKLLLVSWVYDLNFRSSWVLMRDRKLLDMVADTLPDAPEFRDLAVRLREDLARFSSKTGR